MDRIIKIFIVIFIIIIITSMIYSIVKRCCCRNQGTVLSRINGPAISVTTATTHTTHAGTVPNQGTIAPPYPVIDPMHPTPYSAGPHGPGFIAPFAAPTPYPPGPGAGAQYPPTSTYPPANNSYYQANTDPHVNPPPYHVAVSSGSVDPTPTKEDYGKQAPYNPNY